MNVFEIISGYAWREWGVHPHALSRQLFIAGGVAGVGTACLSWQAGNPAVAWFAPGAVPAWFVPILAGFFIWIVMICSHKLGQNAGKNSGLILLPFTLCAIVTAPFVCMNMVFLYTHRMAGEGIKNDLLMPAMLSLVCFCIASRLFSVPLPEPAVGTVTAVPVKPRNKLSVFIFLANIFSLFAWLSWHPSMEAGILLLAYILERLGREFLLLNVPPGGRQARRSLMDRVRDLVPSMSIPVPAVAGGKR